MNWKDFRIAVGSLCLAAAAAAPAGAQPGEDTAKLAREAGPVAVRRALPPELGALKKGGLKVRGDRVVFEGPLSFPPKLKGRTARADVKIAFTDERGLSMRDARQSMRAAAVADARVKEALGDRFALLRSGWVEPEKGGEERPGDRYQLVFYGYSKNTVVTVVASRESKVLDVRSEQPAVQPAESREEVDAAIEIVRADKRHGAAIKGLSGRGIQTDGPDRDRYLYLLFYRAPRTKAVFEATVNMSAGKVVEARALR